MSETLTVSELLSSLLRDCTLVLKDHAHNSEPSSAATDIKPSDTKPAMFSAISTQDLAVSELSVHCTLPIAGIKTQSPAKSAYMPQAHCTHSHARQELLLETRPSLSQTFPLFEVRIKMRSK